MPTRVPAARPWWSSRPSSSSKATRGRTDLETAREIADKLPVVVDARGEPGDTKPALLRACQGSCRVGPSWEEARQVARSITKAPGDIAWKHIVTVQSERGETDAALQTAEQIHSGSEKGEALKAVVAALVRANDLTRASRLADSIEKGFWQVEALLEIAKGQARAGRRREVAEIMARVRQEAEPSRTSPS